MDAVSKKKRIIISNDSKKANDFLLIPIKDYFRLLNKSQSN